MRNALSIAICFLLGTVGETRVIKSLDADYGLDALTVLAIKCFLFEPALKDGRPIATKAILEAGFVLK